MSYPEIEKKRDEFKASKETIERTDHGAGSSFSNPGIQQRIGTIARHALSSPFQCGFLARMAQYIEAKTILEFGSSLGISSAYLAYCSPATKVITIEGDPELARRAKKMFAELGLVNIRMFQSTFEDFISTESQTLFPFDMVFLDGNHQSKALLTYYHSLKHLYTPNTIIIVDDISWSRDMKEGWTTMIGLPEVTQSVDCYHFGLLFFNPGFLQKENHIIKLPWRSVFR